MGPELIRAALYEKMRDAQKADVEALLAELPAGRPKPERLTRKEAAKAAAAAAAATQSSAAGEGSEAVAAGAAAVAAVEEEPEQVGAAWTLFWLVTDRSVARKSQAAGTRIRSALVAAMVAVWLFNTERSLLDTWQLFSACAASTVAAAAHPHSTMLLARATSSVGPAFQLK
jgi:hypothetical protein